GETLPESSDVVMCECPVRSIDLRPEGFIGRVGCPAAAPDQPLDRALAGRERGANIYRLATFDGRTESLHEGEHFLRMIRLGWKLIHYLLRLRSTPAGVSLVHHGRELHLASSLAPCPPKNRLEVCYAPQGRDASEEQ